MSSKPALLRRFATIEPLESRIAPATLFVGNSSLADLKYADTVNPVDPAHPHFFSTNALKANFDATDALGANFVGGDDTYYIRLTAGDRMLEDTGGYKDFITVQKGTVVAFFVDKNLDGEVDRGELTGLSLGANTVISIFGDVDGAIVTNFNDASGKIQPASLIGSGQNIQGLTLDNAGAILAGGNIGVNAAGKQKVSAKSVGNVLAGTAANGFAYNWNNGDPSDAGADGTLVVAAPAPGVAGATIANASFTDVGTIGAGDGGAGAAGGALSNISLKSDATGFVLQAGHGGAGDAAHPKGGAGGAVKNIRVSGVADTSNGDVITITAGKGGDAFGANTGGAGGKVSKVYIGFEKQGSQMVPSAASLSDSIQVVAGDGGAGRNGGAGGSLAKIQAITVVSDVAGDEIQFLAGNGGANNDITGGRTGHGGSVKNSEAREFNNADPAVSVLVTGGAAGALAPGSAAGGNDGGGVSKLKITGFNVTITGGDGSDSATVGGKGGSVADVVIENISNVQNRSTVITAGDGGSGAVGGSGGGISNLKNLDAELAFFTLQGGNGGVGTSGAGGNGGSVRNALVLDSVGGIGGNALIQSGAGGNGTANGGNAGDVKKIQYAAFGVDYVVAGGAGGDATANGNGGKGGLVSNSSFANALTIGSFGGDGWVNGGVGGQGAGTGRGGAGGSVERMNATTASSLNVAGGAGGSSAGGAAGAGGGLKTVGATALAGDVTLVGGSAGAVSALPGNGGSISGSNVVGETNVTIQAGDGAAGGSGGSITNVAFAGVFDGTDIAPDGSVLVQAGQGSSGPAAAGAGGRISGLTGYVGNSGTTTLVAGDGAGSGDGTRAAAGGAVSGVTIIGGGGGGVEFRIAAGDAGDAAAALRGAAGGSVSNVAVGQLESGTIFRYINAGDGGDAAALTGTGGAGGSIVNVAVNYDIGVRSGQAFGMNTMGGLFAGAGGGGFLRGSSGDVLKVNADGIASIVAGKLMNGDTINPENLVRRVSDIILNGNQPATVDGTGAFTNFLDLRPDGRFATNIVGGIVNPAAANANLFDAGEFTDNGDAEFSIGDTTTAQTDGFIAAISFAANKCNFVPEALLTVDDPALPPSAANTQFIDSDNQ